LLISSDKPDTEISGKIKQDKAYAQPGVAETSVEGDRGAPVQVERLNLRLDPQRDFPIASFKMKINGETTTGNDLH
jgi:hypothetical protein